jgi:hypothetical protein
MTVQLPTPPISELARAKGDTVPELQKWFADFYNRGGAPFNYRSGTKAIRAAYRGIDKLHLLTAGCEAEKTNIGRVSNREIVELAAPLAFGRSTQVFDIPPRRFPFGRERYAAYRIPFLFVENTVVKVFYLQPRKGACPTIDEIGMIATIIKTYLLDTEFYGLETDIEFVDLSAPFGCKDRSITSFSLSDLPIWSEKRLGDRLTLLSEAIDSLQESDDVAPRTRRAPAIDPSMPLFD